MYLSNEPNSSRTFLKALALLIADLTLSLLRTIPSFLTSTAEISFLASRKLAGGR